MSTHDPLAGLRVPEVRYGLRERALAAAKRAAAEPTPRANWVDVLWEWRLFWRIWAGAVAALLAAYVWVGRSLSPASDQGPVRSDGTTLAGLEADYGAITALGPRWSQERAAAAWEALDREDWLSR